jgi:uncharacterized membrane protein YhaH (DUF805 family)
MKKYYYSNGGDRQGPVTIAELKSVPGFNPGTLVWMGNSGWTRAGDIAELSELFASVPPVAGSASAVPPNQSKQKLFAHPFSFTGRIRRKEYLFTVLISTVISGLVSGVIFLIGLMTLNLITMITVNLLLSLAMLFFNLAQGAKRSHDIGKSGWWQLIPFYNLYLFFPEGDKGSNEYGPDPKYLSSVVVPQGNSVRPSAVAPPPLPSSFPPPSPTSPPPLPHEVALPHQEDREMPNFRIEAIRSLKTRGKDFDEYDLELEIENQKASYLKSEEERRASYLKAEEERRKEAERHRAEEKARLEEAHRKEEEERLKEEKERLEEVARQAAIAESRRIRREEMGY